MDSTLFWLWLAVAFFSGILLTLIGLYIVQKREDIEESDPEKDLLNKEWEDQQKGYN